MKHYFISFILGLTLLSCSNDDMGAFNFEGQTFIHSFFDTEQECLEAQPTPDFFINCHQELRILDSNRAEIMLTDILYSVTYIIENNTLMLLPSESPYEFDENLTFEIIDNKTLKSIDFNSTWKLMEGNSIWN